MEVKKKNIFAVFKQTFLGCAMTGKDAKAQAAKREIPTIDKEITMKVVKHWNRLPSKGVESHPWRYLNIDWT